jgi:hypothetical protein
MKRRSFITKTVLAATVLGSTSVYRLLAASESSLLAEDRPKISSLTPELQAAFLNLMGWMKNNGWLDYLKSKTGIHFDPAGSMDQYFKNIKVSGIDGFDDFAGSQLIQPGLPAGSLLYHLMASPRIQPNGFQPSQYPQPEQVDLLENVIYASGDYSHLSYDKMVLAVFAYEYRPAYKTPHHQHADLVFSRTGVARIGKQPWNYDPLNRCFTNLPVAGDPKSIAATPARYGVFLAKIKDNDLGLSQIRRAEGTDDQIRFLQPVRKVFDQDSLISTGGIQFRERHVSEKLKCLVRLPNMLFDNPVGSDGKNLFDLDKPPFLMDSITYDKLVGVVAKGSSALIAPVPGRLVDYAKQRDKLACLHVPRHQETYFSALNTLPIEDIEVISKVTNNAIDRGINYYQHPRRGPLFVNIKHVFDAGTGEPDFTFAESKISHRDGIKAVDVNRVAESFYAALFTDNICDGCITADTHAWKSSVIPETILESCLPAFSIVTAPDFFQLADSIDLEGFDRDGPAGGTNFYEGGLYNLSEERTPVNQRSKNPVTGGPAFDPPVSGNRKTSSMLAVYCDQPVMTGKPQGKYDHPGDRGYKATSFLPDVCSGVFAPGWDITYANEEQNGTDQAYLTTRGLGSPFPEDMKLCAAMNGMWPAASPDASRTYQGSLMSGDRNPTAIPLLDVELGLHTDSAACKEHSLPATTGWDGEQGPFMEFYENLWRINYCDLARTDTVKKAFEDKLDMSRLRNIDSRELRKRMSCLALCTRYLPSQLFREDLVRGVHNDELIKIPALTALWLVSAEAVDWKTGASGLGLPKSFAGTHFDQMTKPYKGIAGNGYLYIFALTEFSYPDDNDANRGRQECTVVFVCQVTEKQINFVQLPGGGAGQLQQLNWTSHA